MEAPPATDSSEETVMLHREYQAAREAELLSRAARRRMVRRAERAAKAARTA